MNATRTRLQVFEVCTGSTGERFGMYRDATDEDIEAEGWVRLNDPVEPDRSDIERLAEKMDRSIARGKADTRVLARIALEDLKAAGWVRLTEDPVEPDHSDIERVARAIGSVSLAKKAIAALEAAGWMPLTEDHRLALKFLFDWAENEGYPEISAALRKLSTTKRNGSRFSEGIGGWEFGGGGQE